ncbi:hypothetical protein FACS1894130_00520 [Spirochaetia bacterium]|nr:hypothetical protein FACS1894130_00520 [Spirochaetia bacterium]
MIPVRLCAAMVFLNMVVFVAPGATDGNAHGSVENTVQAQITNIPGEVKNGGQTYKIFIMLSTGTSAKAGYVAKGEALINGENSVIVDLTKPDGQSWSGTGRFNIAIVISPKEVSTSKDIDVHGGEKHFSSKIQHIAWTPGLVNLHDIVPAQVEELFDGVIKPDSDIRKK